MCALTVFLAVCSSVLNHDFPIWPKIVLLD